MIGLTNSLLHAQNGVDICDCFANPHSPQLTVSDDITICEGDTIELSTSVSGGISSSPFLNIVWTDSATALPLSLSVFQLNGASEPPLDISSIGRRVVAMADINDSLHILTASGQLLYIDTLAGAAVIDTVAEFDSRISSNWVGLAWDPSDSTLYGLSNDPGNESVLYELNTNTSDTTLVGEYIPAMSWLTSSPTGSLFLGNIQTDSLYKINPATAQITTVGPYNVNSATCQGADFDRTTGELYALMEVTGGFSVIGILDTVSGSFCAADSAAVPAVDLCPFNVRDSEYNAEGLTYSWSPTTGLSDTSSSQTLAYPVATTTYTVYVEDQCGNIDSNEVTVTVNNTPNPLNSQSCVASVNISLDSNCMAVVQPSEILTANYVCADEFFEAIIEDGRPAPIVDGQDLGQTLQVRIQPIGGGNSCWADILIEDKLDPVIICENDTVAYGQTPSPAQTDDNCGVVDIDTLNLVPFAPMPCDTNLLYGYTETVVAIDGYGNRSDTCTRTVFVERPVIGQIEFPDSLSLPSNNPISCETSFPETPQGYPTPDFAGEPLLEGTPINDLPMEYNIGAFFTDMPQGPATSCKTSVLRVWNVVTWVCNDPDTIGTWQQLIEVVDTLGPNIVCPQFDTLTTTGPDCSTSLNIPYPVVNDNCSGVDRVTVSYDFGFINDLTQAGATIELPVGTHEITYTALDNCTPPNFSSCTFTVVVEDRNQPVIQARIPNVGLNNFGPTRVYASSFDNGSYDDCALDYIEIARMSDMQFGPFIDFDCSDVGAPVMIILRGFDEAGNSNQVMTEINVQDKDEAIIIAPDDITISCEYPIDFTDLSEFGTVVMTDNPNAINNRQLEPNVDSILLTDPGDAPVMERFYGLDGIIYDNCGASFTVEDSVESFMCNTFRITRTFSAIANGVVEDTDVQHIYVQNVNTFDEKSIAWPRDTMFTAMCSGPSLEPENLPEGYDFPSYTEGPCSDVAVSHKDSEFYSLTPGDSVCTKILREWQVMDWCNRSRSGEPIIYRHTQLIKVVNTTAPTFTTACEDLTECSFAANCGPGFIALSQAATDDCTSEENLVWRYTIDPFNDGVGPFIYGSTNDASGVYPVGQHEIIWTVEDECGNVTNCVQLFEIEACKTPTPISLSGVILELTPMDTTGDGQADIAMAQITAQQLGYDSYHACGYEVFLSFNQNDLADSIAVFDCEDVGIQELTLWVTDEKGRQDFLRTYVAVQDNQLFCGNDPGPIFPITGNISSPTGLALPDTEVEMDGDTYFSVMTDDQGQYDFPDMPEGGAYTITPTNDKEHLNGVSTFDILLIQQFVLGLNDFDDPLTHIAADVDNSGRISGKDIIELRKTILGFQQSFPNNTSWRFVDRQFVFSPDNPLSQNFPESYEINGLNASMEIDFTAVKVGDVNGSAQLGGKSVEGRSQDIYWTLKDDLFQEGQDIQIPVYAGENMDEIFGFQWSVGANDRFLEITGVKAGQLEVSSDQMHLDASGMKVSWVDAKGVELEDGTPLFYLTAKAKSTGKPSYALFVSEDLHAECYTHNGQHDVAIQFRSDAEQLHTFELLQNQPNPVKSQTLVKFSLPRAMDAQLIITDVNGRRVLEERGSFAKGWNQFEIHRSKLEASGVYYYQLRAGSFHATKKMILVD
jgi:hypothetical protein